MTNIYTAALKHIVFLGILILIHPNIKAQVIFSEDFGQHTTRTRCPYTPVGNIVNRNCFIYAEPTIPDNPTTTGINESKYAQDIDNNHYAVIAPKYIADQWDPTDLGWYFWTSTSDPGPTPGSARAYTDDHTTGDTDGAVLVLNAGTTLSSIYRRPIYLEAGHYYRLSFWTYVANSTANIRVKVMSPSGNSTLCTYETGNILATNTWVQKAPEFILNTGCTSGYYTFDMINCNADDAGNDFYIDDILFEEIPSSTSANTIICQTTEPIAVNDTSLANTVGVQIVVPILNNDTASDGSSAQTNANITVTLITPNGAKNFGTTTTAEVIGEGTWFWDEWAKTLKFTPIASFDGDPTPVTYSITDNTNMTSSWATVYITCINTPRTKNDTAQAYIGDPVTVSIFDNDKLADETTTPTSSDVSFQFIDIYGIVLPSTSSSLFVAQEGTWVYNSGQLTFTPLAGFTGDPSPIEYKITQTSTSTTSAPSWVIINYKATFTSAIDPIGICSGMELNYTATSSTTNTEFSWTRASVTGITNSARTTNSAVINEILYNSTTSPIVVSYVFSYGIGSNLETQTLSVTVKPSPVLTIFDQEACDAQVFTLIASATPNPCDFEWKDMSNNVLSTTDTYTTGTLNTKTLYAVKATATSNSCYSIDTLTVMINPRNATWNGSVSPDWFDENNWTTSPTTGGIPTACTDVIIPADMPNYCTLNHAGECHYITYKPEAGVFGLEHLSYQRAYVEMTVQRDKWYTLTTPLKEMYSGDYYFEGAPVSFMRLFDAINPDSTNLTAYKYTGRWTRNFANLNTRLAPGAGFAFMLGSTEWHYPAPKSIVSTDYTIYFPRRKADSTLILTDTIYNGINGYKYRNMPVISLAKDVNKVYRFANENNTNTLAPIEITLNPGLNLIGNPLMTHLNFTQLLAHNGNSSVIRNAIKIWNGNTFTSFMSGEDFEASSAFDNGVATSIPPMQAFFVYSDAGGMLTIDPNTDFTTNSTSKLRSSKQLKNCVFIETDNGLHKSTCSVILNKNASNKYGKDDAFKLFSQYTEVPEVYTMQENKNLDINQFSKYPYITPLAIYSTNANKIKLQFKGVQSFDDCDLYLINTSTGIEQNLKDNPHYEIDNIANTTGSLFLEFRNANTTISTDIAETETNEIQILSKEKNTIQVYCDSSNEIENILVLNEIGHLVYEETNINRTIVDINKFASNSFYIVKVKTKKANKGCKLIVK